MARTPEDWLRNSMKMSLTDVGELQKKGDHFRLFLARHGLILKASRLRVAENAPSGSKSGVDVLRT